MVGKSQQPSADEYRVGEVPTRGQKYVPYVRAAAHAPLLGNRQAEVRQTGMLERIFDFCRSILSSQGKKEPFFPVTLTKDCSPGTVLAGVAEMGAKSVGALGVIAGRIVGFSVGFGAGAFWLIFSGLVLLRGFNFQESSALIGFGTDFGAAIGGTAGSIVGFIVGGIFGAIGSLGRYFKAW
jgi:hypothetical protein